MMSLYSMSSPKEKMNSESVPHKNGGINCFSSDGTLYMDGIIFDEMMQELENQVQIEKTK